MMVELRKSKGLTREEASRLIEDPLYLGVLMIKNGDADGEVSGADHATGDVLRPAFHYVKTAPGISVVSGAFIMILQDKNFGENGILVYADGAVHPDPNDKELAEIGPVDLLLIPVGGHFTIDPKEATRVADQIRPKVVIPMHFKTEKVSFPIVPLEEFLKGKLRTKRAGKSEAVLDKTTLPAQMEIVVLEYAL